MDAAMRNLRSTHCLPSCCCAGSKVTRQEFVSELRRLGVASNSPHRRMSEARKWLREHGVPVSFTLEGRHPQHKRWFIGTQARFGKEADAALRVLTGIGA